MNGHLFHNLTAVLILIPIGMSLSSHPTYPHMLTIPSAAGLSGLSVLFGLCGAAYHRAGTVFMTLLSALAFLVTLVAWVIEMVLFGVARNHLRDRGIDAKWGNANWIVLGALVALFLAFFASLCGSFGRYSYGRKRAVAAY